MGEVGSWRTKLCLPCIWWNWGDGIGPEDQALCSPQNWELSSGYLTCSFVCIELSVSSHPLPTSCLSRFRVSLCTDWIYLSHFSFFPPKEKYLFISKPNKCCVVCVGVQVVWLKAQMKEAFPTCLLESSPPTRLILPFLIRINDVLKGVLVIFLVSKHWAVICSMKSQSTKMLQKNLSNHFLS